MKDKKPQLQNAELIGQILTACIDLQNRGWGTVFFELIAHINKVEIHMYKGVWVKDAEYTIGLHSKTTDTDRLNSILSRLKSLIETPMHNPKHQTPTTPKPEPECYYCDIGGFNWYKEIRKNEYLRITYFSDCSLPDIAIEDSPPSFAKQIPFAEFDAKHKQAIEQLSNL